MPFQQLVNGPSGQAQIVTGREHGTTCSGGVIAHPDHIAGSKIEIHAREVALILISDLKYGTIVAAESASATFTGALRCAISTITKRIVTALGVHPSVNGEHVMQISISSI